MRRLTSVTALPASLGIPVRADVVREFLVQRRPADDDLDPVAQAGLGQLPDDGLHLRHRRGEQGRKGQHVRPIFLDLLQELLGGHVDAQIADLEADPAQHRGNDVLADVVQVPAHGADQDLAPLPHLVLRQERLERCGRFVHGARGQQHLRDEHLPAAEPLADDLHRGQHALLQDVAGVDARLQQLLHVLRDRQVVAREHVGLDVFEPLREAEGRARRRGLVRGCEDRVEPPGLDRQTGLLGDALPDAADAVEDRVGGNRVGDAEDHPPARGDRLEEVRHVSVELLVAGAFLQEQDGRDPPVDRERPAPPRVVLVHRDLGHRVRRHGLGHVHARVADQIHQPPVLAVAVAGNVDPLGAQGIGRFADPRHDVRLEVRGVGDHVVEVGPPVDGLSGRAADEVDGLVEEGGHALGERRHLAPVVLVVEKELGRVDEVLLDVVHRGRGAARHGEGQAVFADVALPGDEVVPVGVELQVGEDVGQGRVVFRRLDRMLLNVESGDPRPPHGLGEHDARADVPPGGVVGDACAPVVVPDVDVHVRGQRVVEDHLLEGEDPQSPVDVVLGPADILVGGVDLVQSPAFGARDLVLGAVPVRGRQPAQALLGRVPEVQPGGEGDDVRHLPPDRLQDALLVGHSFLLRCVWTARGPQPISKIFRCILNDRVLAPRIDAASGRVSRRKGSMSVWMNTAPCRIIFALSSDQSWSVWAE